MSTSGREAMGVALAAAVIGGTTLIGVTLMHLNRVVTVLHEQLFPR